LVLKGTSTISEAVFTLFGFSSFSGKLSGIGHIKEDNNTDCYWLPKTTYNANNTRFYHGQ
jgi:hypothetical protein